MAVICRQKGYFVSVEYFLCILFLIVQVS